MPYADPHSERALETKRQVQRRYEAAHPGTVRAWRAAHPEETREQRRRSRERNREKRVAESRAYNLVHREELAEKQRVRYAENGDAMRADARSRAHRRREGRLVWLRIDPWPTVCALCGMPFEGRFPGPLAETVGHEPPVAWMSRHPEYSGAAALRPEHWACNRRKGPRPDWEIAA